MTDALRSRLDATNADVDRPSIRGPRTARCLVKIYDGGSMPDTTPRFFLAHPVTLDGDECESCNPGIRVHTDEEMSVLVLGPTVPAVGDSMVATLVGGRWVAGFGGGEPPGTDYCGTSCEACGGVLLKTEGTFSDDNHSGVISDDHRYENLNAGKVTNVGDESVWLDPAISSSPADHHWASGPLTVTRPIADQFLGCVGSVGEIRYAWGVDCHPSGDVSITMYCDVRVCCDSMDENDLRYTPWNKIRRLTPTTATKTVTPTCDGTKLTATASGWVIPDPSGSCTGHGLAAPATTITIEIPLVITPDNALCCSPCAIPKKDLTITVGASSTTLVYIIDEYGESRWSDGTYTIQCIDSIYFNQRVTLTGPGTWDLIAGASSCDPFHVEFDGTSSVNVDE